MVPEAPLEDTDTGRVAKGDGWYVLNAKDAQWWYTDGRPAFCNLEGEAKWDQMGFNMSVLWPGQPLSQYHWEADQEGFFVVSGEALLIVEDVERPLRQWDFVHLPVDCEHTIVGAGSGNCVLVAAGSRVTVGREDWGAYTVSEVAGRHGASVESETTDAKLAYSRWKPSRPVRYGGWLPGD
jgi:uncharacterized cupin superfamily protein